ncbi:hypothetical protein SmJEL517_g02931 [Synchytrium microbalum]|uniref:Uncharacterized protein n=1 Tax=Synchytrium microbalum TaxID=1806994 RepID=A0A507C4I7_9FUNG|nr:uncharacterized protein SmJEL517_g02931 [Synchytrium microbalum]TPX34308.1 hypothetical protein SmJEL517_g02931 [Synchytrium microbalum]
MATAAVDDRSTSQIQPEITLNTGAGNDATSSNNAQPSSEEWLLLRVGTLPRNSLGWFRAGVGFYNKREYARSIECFERAIEMDPNNARKDEAIAALKRSVVLDNPSDWQLLVELTSNLD